MRNGLPTLARRKWFAGVALAVAASFVNAEVAGLLAFAGGVATAQPAPAQRRLALFVTPKTAKDATAAMVVRGLLRGTADRLATAGVARAGTSPCADPAAPAQAAAKVEEGRAALAAQKWEDAYRAYSAADTALQMCLGGADRALVAKTCKGLGVAAQASRRPPSESRDAIRRALLLWPGQKATDYAYSVDARNLFASVQRDIDESPNGLLAITTTPPGGEVYVDYEFRGFGPVKVSGLAAGEHLVSVFQDGHLLWSQFVAVRGGPEQALEVTMGSAPFKSGMEEALASVAKAADKGRSADGDMEKLARMTAATDVVVLAVAMDKSGFAVTGSSWAGGRSSPIRAALARDATLVTSTQGVLASALGVGVPAEAPLAALEPPPVAVPGTEGTAQPMPVGEGEEYVIDPNSPIFRDTGKKAASRSVFKQCWFWSPASCCSPAAAARAASRPDR
ncbi:MAG: PEGA domain-containing protein [Deltaproteobacteria bacterium]|nr:PEGA domain-containing protein [Deltaproteobacteria bacterium]